MRELWSAYYREFRRLRGLRSYPLAQEGVVFHCPLTLRRRHNLALQQINRALLGRRELAMPHILSVGVTTACNLRCPACPTGTKALGRPSQHLDYDLFVRTVNQLRGQLMLMPLWDWGEPLLHPRLADMIRHASAAGIRTVVSTNGTINNQPDKLERLVTAGLDLVIVCIDGLTQDVHEKYRVGGKLSEVLDTLDRFVECKRRLGRDRPVIEFRTLATRYNQTQLPALMALAQERGADLFGVKSFRPFDYRGHDVERELVPLDPNLARYADPDEWRKSSATRPPLTCAKPLYAPTLNSDGRLAFCFYAREEDEFFGDLRPGGFRKVWRSAAARAKRLNFLQREGTRSCENCYFRHDHKPTILHSVQLRELPRDISLQRPQTPAQFLAAVRAAAPLLEPV